MKTPLPLLACLVASCLNVAAQAGPFETLTIALKVEGVPRPNAVDKLGRCGAFTIYSQARWDAFLLEMTALGWSKPADQGIDQIDFEKEMLVGVLMWTSTRAEMAPPVRTLMNGPKGPCLRFVVHQPIAENARRLEVGEYRIQLVRTTRSPDAYVELYQSSKPVGQAGDEKLMHIASTVGPRYGDVLDRLAAEIEAKSATVNAGADINVQFRLRMRDLLNAMPHAALAVATVHVWDGKYSNGYRNHAFEVRKPDGSVVVLQNPVKEGWDKNAPHVVHVTPPDDYVIPSRTEDKAHLSLKELGLDTMQPGKYSITGWYSEDASNNHPEIWVGRIISNTIEVEVK